MEIYYKIFVNIKTLMYQEPELFWQILMKNMPNLGTSQILD